MIISNGKNVQKELNSKRERAATQQSNSFKRTNERGMFQLYTKYPLQAYLDKRAHTLLPPFLILSRTLSHFSLSPSPTHPSVSTLIARALSLSFCIVSILLFFLFPTTHPSVPTLIVKPLSLSISFFMCCFYLTFLSKSINTPFYLYS